MEEERPERLPLKVMKKSYEIDMLHGPLLSKILLFAIPLGISSILQLLFNAADVVVLGQFVSAEALAAVGSTSSLVNLIVNFFVGISVGVNVLVAQSYARGEDDRVSEIVHTSIASALLSGFLLIFVGIWTAEPLLLLMGAPDDTIGMSVSYLRIYYVGMPFVVTYNFGAALLRAVGDTRRPLYYLFLAGIVNVILNLYFVLVWGMGVEGVAIATTVSNFISSVLVVLTLMKENTALKLKLTTMRLDLKVLKRIYKIGLPSGLQSTMFSVSNMVIQSSINAFGSVAMAGSTAASNIEGFIYAGMNAVYQADLSFTSQNVGARRYGRINKILMSCILATTIVGLAFGTISCVFGTQLLSLYNTDAEVIASGLTRLYLVSAPYVICGYMDVIAATLRGLNDTFVPTIITLICVCGFRILWIFTVHRVFTSLEVLYLSYPISWTITMIFELWRFRKVRRHFPFEDAPDAI